MTTHAHTPIISPIVIIKLFVLRGVYFENTIELIDILSFE